MGVNPRSRRQQRIAADLQNRRPFTGTLNADIDPETGHYVVRSYDTPIGRSFHHPETGELIRSLSEQQFSSTTTQHQHIVRQHLGGETGPPIGHQSWTHQDWGYMRGGSQSPESAAEVPARPPRPRRPVSPFEVHRTREAAIEAGGRFSTPSAADLPPTQDFHSMDMGHGMLLSELLGPEEPHDDDLFHIPEREPVQRVFNDRRRGDRRP